MSFKQQLIKLEACKDAIDWIEDRTLQQAWDECPCGDWMLWLLEEMEGKEGWLNEKEIMLLSCWCVRRVLKYLPKEETRPLKAIEAKEKWARGEITRKEMKIARDIARAASFHDAKTVVWTTTCSVTKFDVAWAASSVTACSAASSSARADANVTVSDKESLIQADYIRSQFTLPKGDLCLLNNN